MYKFEEILFGNKSELLKQASIPSAGKKVDPYKSWPEPVRFADSSSATSTRGTVGKTGRSTGIRATNPPKFNPQGNPVGIQPATSITGRTSGESIPSYNASVGYFNGIPLTLDNNSYTNPPFNTGVLTYPAQPAPRTTPVTSPNIISGYTPTITGPVYSSLDGKSRSTVSETNVRNHEALRSRGVNSLVGQFQSWDEPRQRAFMQEGFQLPNNSPYNEFVRDAQEEIRKRGLYPVNKGSFSNNIDNQLSQSRDPIVRQNAQRRIGDNTYATNVANIMYQQAQQREQQRQWQAQRDLQDAQKAIKKYNVGGNMKGMTPQDWMAMNPLQRGEYINNYNRDQYKQRSEEILNNADVQAAERQRFADNMNRVHGKAWDARGFTQEQRDAFIDKEFQHSLDKRKQVVGPKTTEGVTQTAQAAPAQSVAPQKSNPVIELLPQIEQDITPEDNTTVSIDKSKPVSIGDIPEGSFNTDENGNMIVSASANIMSILFPQRARDIVKEYF